MRKENNRKLNLATVRDRCDPIQFIEGEERVVIGLEAWAQINSVVKKLIMIAIRPGEVTPEDAYEFFDYMGVEKDFVFTTTEDGKVRKDTTLPTQEESVKKIIDRYDARSVAQ